MFNRFSKRKEELDKLFYPSSIVVIGASNEKSKIGGYIFSEILKKKDITIYPINVKWKEVQGIRAYTNVLEINKKIDLAIIAIPSNFVIDAVKNCAEANIKNIVIISAGFKEIGEEGKQREEELKKIIQEKELNVVGPNCLGFLNAEIGLNCSFAKDVPSFGGTALISQSGAVIDALIDWSFKHNVGFSKVVSLGNMAGIDELVILKYLKNDSKTTSVVFYMETLEKGKEFGKVLKEISKTKPVIIIKPGNSQMAKKAIGSHTGSLAQDNILVETLIKENNGILVKSLNELYNILIALKANFPNNNKLMIVTNAGGPGVIATDIVAKTNFEMYKLNESQKKKFDFLPKEGSLNNPIDILGDAKSDRYEGTIDELSKNPEIENILVLLTPQIMTDSENIARKLIDVSKNSKKCIFSCFLGDKEIKKAINLFDKEIFANFATPSEALIAMNYLYEYSNFSYEDEHPHYNFNKEKIEIINQELDGKKGLLGYELTRKILEIFAIGLPDKEIISKKEDIYDIILDPHKKYVLKGDGEKLIHKKEIGGVELNIDIHNFKEKAEKMFAKLEKITNEFTITIEEEVKGTEVIVGLKSDDELGNFIMFGAGGTFVSIFKDINFATCPLNKKKAEELVKKSKIYTLLKGYRGNKPVYFEHLYEILVRMSFMQEVFPQIKEVDLNPVICSDKGIYLVDVKLIL